MVSLPIYVTRPRFTGDIDPDGTPIRETASYSVYAWMPSLAMPLVLLNVILWSLYGLYLLATLVVG